MEKQDKKKVFIVRSRDTDPGIQKIAKALFQAGYEVTLLVWNRTGRKKQSTEIPGYKIKYFNFRAPQDKIPAVFFFPFWWLYELYYLFKSDSDIVHSCDFDTQYPAIIYKIIFKKTIVYMIYDFYANNLPPGNFQWLRNSIRLIIAQIEKFGIGFSDLLILVDESRYEEIKGAKIGRILYIYNTPEDLFEQNMLPLTTSDKAPIIIFYAGVIHKFRGITHMITALKDLNDILLILAGSVVDNTLLPKANIQNVKYVGWIPTYEEVIRKTMESDILFRFSDPNHPKTRYESPNKLFEAMMCGKPIIVSDKSSMADIVKTEKCGIVVTYANLDEIKDAVITLKNNRSLREELGINGRMAYQKKYSWKIMERRLIDGYKRIL